MLELIIMFVCGFFFAVFLCGLGFLFLIGKNYPTDEELEEMQTWYDAEYGKENDR